jgi:hypothetical protein
MATAGSSRRVMTEIGRTHTVRGMGRTILTIVGVILAVWLVLTVVGAIMSMLKMFFFIGFVAVLVMLAVTLISKLSRSR